MHEAHLSAPHAFGDEGRGCDRPTSPAWNYRIATGTSVCVVDTEAFGSDE